MIISTTTLLALILSVRTTPLNYSPYLERTAMKTCLQMVERKHNRAVMQKLTERFDFVGENLAFDFYNEKDMVEALQASPTHRKVQTSNKYTEVGMATCQNKAGYTTIFLYGGNIK